MPNAAPKFEQPPANHTEEEIAKYEDLIPRKHIKVDAEGKDVAPGFQFQIIQARPKYADSARYGVSTDLDYQIEFEVVKESRTQTVLVKRRLPGGQEMENREPKIVQRMAMKEDWRGLSTPVLNDADSGFSILARDFVKQFNPI